MKIFKYPVQLLDTFYCTMPKGAVVLSTQMQDGLAEVWALVDEQAEKVGHLFYHLPFNGSRFEIGKDQARGNHHDQRSVFTGGKAARGGRAPGEEQIERRQVMASTVKELRVWLSALNEDDEVGIDEDGLTLEAVGASGVYLEIGGLPDPADSDIEDDGDGD